MILNFSNELIFFAAFCEKIGFVLLYEVMDKNENLTLDLIIKNEKNNNELCLYIFLLASYVYVYIDDKDVTLSTKLNKQFF